METLGGTRADLIINTASGGFSSGFYGKHSSCLSIVCFKKKKKSFWTAYNWTFKASTAWLLFGPEQECVWTQQ